MPDGRRSSNGCPLLLRLVDHPGQELTHQHSHEHERPPHCSGGTRYAVSAGASRSRHPVGTGDRSSVSARRAVDPWRHRLLLQVTPTGKERDMKTIPIIAQLRSTSGYDTDAPYVYLEVDTELLARIEKAVSLYSRHQNDPSLKLSKLTIHGPSMTALVNLPELTEEQQASLDEDESIQLTSTIPEMELNVLESCIRLCGEGIDILDARCLYAVSCNKHTRDMYEANIGAVLRHLLESRHHPGKEELPDADD